MSEKEALLLEKFISKTGLQNLEKAYILSWIGLATFFCFLILSQLFNHTNWIPENIKWAWHLCLVALACFAVPVLHLRRSIHAIKTQKIRPSYKLLYTFLISYLLIILPIIYFETLFNNSNTTLIICILLMNLVFVLCKKVNLYFNILYLIILIGSVYLMDKEFMLKISLFIQGCSVIVPTYLLASYQSDLLHKNFVSKELLKEKNEHMQVINAELNMKALQSQMNPHFIFNTLNAIQHYLLSNDKRASLTYLSRFAQLIRQIFQYSNKNTITLEEELQFLKLYLDLESLRFENKVSIDLQVDQILEKKCPHVKIPPLLLQPIIENAFKHGLLHKTTPGILKILFQCQNEQYLKCIVEDNGVGRKHANKAGHWRTKDKTKESGLKIVQKRLDLLNAKQTNLLSNQLHITDLVDEHNQAIGTRVEIFLSVR